jgi:hypothetical protein
MSLISNRLDAIFEEASAGANPIEAAMEIVRKLDAAKQLVLDLQNQLDISRKGMSGNLALGIRRRHPSFNIGVDNDGCKVGYRSKYLLFRPDISNGVWAVSSPDDKFLRKFTGNNPQAIVLRSDITPLADAVVTYFRNHYKTLGEDINGDGVTLVEGKRGTSLDIMTWKNCSRPRLMSRKARRLL